MILAQVKQEPSSNSQTNNTQSLNPKKIPEPDRYMEEEKEYSSKGTFLRNQREEGPNQVRQFKRTEEYKYKDSNQEHRGYNNYKEHDNYRDSNWNKRDDKFQKKSDYNESYLPREKEERPTGRHLPERNLNYEEQPQNYRQINNPGDQVWRGQQQADTKKQPERVFQSNKRQTDAILDNIRTREDVKSIHMIFTKLKGQRYIETIERDHKKGPDAKSSVL